MFSFHKPKVYRSSTGCCICKAKSSSSRFTDSRKYEDDLMECFCLGERRTGEICNACVLLVKRWKKLPDGSERNWRHVVDARAGPGTKSLAKFKAKNKKKPKLKAEVREISPAPSDELIVGEINEEILLPRISRKRGKSPCEKKRRRPLSPLAGRGFVDLTLWKRKKTCCGTIFTHLDMVILDPKMLKPCTGRQHATSEISCVNSSSSVEKPTDDQPPEKKLYSDSSSDSGYDESSNQGPPQGTTTATITTTATSQDSVMSKSKSLPIFLSQPLTQTSTPSDAPVQVN